MKIISRQPSFLYFPEGFFLRKKKGLKGLASSVIVMAIILVSSLVVINTINPLFKETNKAQVFNEARQTIHTIDSVINQLILEAPGSQRALDVHIRDGRLIVSSVDDTIRYRIEHVPELVGGGFVAREGNVIIRGGAKMDAYEGDPNGDGQTDLVLENSAMLFSVKKLGSPSSHVNINTSNVISLVRNMRLGYAASLDSGILINNDPATSYGTGFTEIGRIGSNLESSSIRIFMNSTAGITYEAIFELVAGQDFVQLKIKRITGV